MGLINYHYRELDGGWDFGKLEFKNLNLFVGESGSGKTRMLSTIFNLGIMVASGDKKDVKRGSWDLTFSSGDTLYEYSYQGITKDQNNIIAYEKLKSIDGSSETIIFQRSSDGIELNNKPIPKLPTNQSLIYLLKDEDEVNPAYEFFCNIMRRQFQGNELAKSTEIRGIASSFFKQFQEDSPDTRFRNYNLSLNQLLYLLKRYENDKFEIIKETFLDIFPFFEDLKISEQQLSSENTLYIPIIRESGVKSDIHLADLSSGILKTLIILADVQIIPHDGIYLIDEYENSLGINAIDFLPEYLTTNGKGKQFIITTHHPYLINNIPMDNWYVFSRKGSTVTITDGTLLKERYGKSKQEAFIKLINDPIYSGEQ